MPDFIATVFKYVTDNKFLNILQHMFSEMPWQLG